MKIYRGNPQKGAKNQTVRKNKDNDTNDEGKKTKKKYSVHLKNAEDLRRLMCEVVNELRKSKEGNLCARSSKIITAAQVLLNIFEQNGLEERIKKLEDFAQYGGQRR